MVAAAVAVVAVVLRATGQQAPEAVAVVAVQVWMGITVMAAMEEPVVAAAVVVVEVELAAALAAQELARHWPTSTVGRVALAILPMVVRGRQGVAYDQTPPVALPGLRQYLD